MINTAEDIFAVWAPAASPWSLWAKPVLFAQMSPVTIAQQTATPLLAAVKPAPPWLPKAMEKVALVIDTPAAQSVWLGLDVAAAGYRPVPLFNALPGPPTPPNATIPVALVNVWSILTALIAATPELAKINIPADVPPAFLLDSNRRSGVGPLVPNRFDNRSVSFPTDFPSAIFLLSRGIRRVLLIQQKEVAPDSDLAHTLLRWQQGGIRIDTVALEGGEPMERRIEKPSWFGYLWYRLQLMAGLRPVLGGFGGMIPEPSSGGGG
jgi:hypothetical protein